MNRQNRKNTWRISWFLSMYDTHSSYCHTHCLLHIGSRAGGHAIDCCKHCASDFLCFYFYFFTYPWFASCHSQKHRTALKLKQSDWPGDPRGMYLHSWPTSSVFFSSSHKAQRNCDDMPEKRVTVMHSCAATEGLCFVSVAFSVFFFFSLFLLCCHTPTVLWRWFPGTWQGRTRHGRR